MKNKEKVYSIAAIVLMLDQLMKVLIKSKMFLHQEIKVIPNFFSLYYIENQGAAFSILQRQSFLLILISILCLVMIDRYISKEKDFSKLSICSLGIILGGIVGNLVDRILYQKVIDYISLTVGSYSFPVFNIADIGITIGILMLFIESIWKKKLT